MADERDYDRGSFRYAPRAGAWDASYRPSANQPPAYDAYAHSRSQPLLNERPHYAAHEHHQPPSARYAPARPVQREAEWTRSPASHSPTSSLDVAGPSDRHRRQGAGSMAYAPRAATGAISSRSDWMVLPSVTRALSMYGDQRRQEPRFSLVIRQQPRRGLAIGNSQMSLRTARSIPIDPPPVCELLLDRSGDEQLLSLPEVFIRAQLVRGDAPNEECLADARRIEPLVGDTLQSAFNSRIDTREDQSFFVFKELGVRNRGLYRLRFDLFDRVGIRICRVASVYTDAFEVHERRKHPGLSASSPLMDALVDRGMKYKLRKANDKHTGKKRKSPDDFFYGDERAVVQPRRPSVAAAELEARHASASRSPYSDATLQPVRPMPLRAFPGGSNRPMGVEERRDDMLPPIGSLTASAAPAYPAHASVYSNHSAPRLSPPVRERAPALPSLSRLGVQPRTYAPQLHAPPHQQPRHAWSPTEASRLSPFDDRQRPSLHLRSSSSSVTTSAHTSTPNSSTTDVAAYPSKPEQPDDRPHLSALGLGIAKLNADAAADAAPNRAESSQSEVSSDSSDRANRPTLPPISSLYVPLPPPARRASAAFVP